MQHRRKLDTQLTRRVDSHAQLEGVAHTRRFHALAHTAPEGRIKQDHVDSGVEHVCRELLEAYDHGVSRERHPHLLAGPAHTVQTKDRVLEVIVLNIFDGLPEPYSLLSRPNSVWIEAKAIALERHGDSPVALKLIFRSEHTAF